MKKKIHKLYLDIPTSRNKKVTLNTSNFSQNIKLLLPDNDLINRIIIVWITDPSMTNKIYEIKLDEDKYQLLAQEVRKKSGSQLEITSFNFYIKEFGTIFKIVKKKIDNAENV